MCTQSRKHYWVAHHILRAGKEPGVEVGRGTTKLDLGPGGRNQDLGVADRDLGPVPVAPAPAQAQALTRSSLLGLVGGRMP